jgi:hypothetical protein
MKDVIENPVVHFSIHVACENDEPDRVIPAIHGDIFLYGEDGSPETKIGYIEALWVQAGRALNEGESLLEAMDSVSNECEECFCALLEHETEDWKPEVVELYVSRQGHRCSGCRCHRKNVRAIVRSGSVQTIPTSTHGQ